MIRINLLPRQEIREPKRGYGELLLGLLALLAVIGVILATHFSQAGKIKNVKRDIKRTEQKIDDLKEVEKKVNEFIEKNKELERRIQIIAELEKRRSGPLFVMDALSSSIPERAWVNEITSRGGSARIEGIAWNEFTVADFMKSLQKSNYFKNVRLRVIEKKQVSNLPLRSFEISSNLDFLGISEKSEDEEKDNAIKDKT